MGGETVPAGGVRVGDARPAAGEEGRRSDGRLEALSAVERDADKVSGMWLFRNTRVPVAALSENLRDGATYLYSEGIEIRAAIAGGIRHLNSLPLSCRGPIR